MVLAPPPPSPLPPSGDAELQNAAHLTVTICGVANQVPALSEGLGAFGPFPTHRHFASDCATPTRSPSPPMSSAGAAPVANTAAVQRYTSAAGNWRRLKSASHVHRGNMPL